MDANVCDVNHLDADVLLPPRKRLLAGFKRQNSDVDAAAASASAASHHHHAPRPHPVFAVASSSSSASPSTPTPPSPTPCPPTSIEFHTHLNLLVSTHFNNSQNYTPEQIVEASKSAANMAAKAAEIARAAAQEKAMVASKAVAAAREALALVASFPEEGSGTTTSKDKSLKKNKLKKHVQVQMLYEKHNPIESSGDDEELARKLHRVINSSPRISKNSSSSDLKAHKDKKLKISQNAERTIGYHGNVGFGANPSSMGSHVAISGELDSESSIQDASTSRGSEKGSKFEKSSPSRVRMSNGEAESSRSKEKMGGNASSPSKRRGRLKLKKLSLSTCNIRDQANPKDDLIIPRASPLTDKNMGNSPSTANRLKPLFPLEARGDKKVVPMEAAPPTWKCQDFKAPACVKQNKVMQS